MDWTNLIQVMAQFHPFNNDNEHCGSTKLRGVLIAEVIVSLWTCVLHAVISFFTSKFRDIYLLPHCNCRMISEGIYRRLIGLSGLAHSNVVSWTAWLEPAVSARVCVCVCLCVFVCVCGWVWACGRVGGRINATASCWIHSDPHISRSAVTDKRSRREMFLLRFVLYRLGGSGLMV